MTRPHDTPPRAFSSVDEVAQALRDRGGRLTASRRRVLETLFGAGAPVSAEQIATADRLDTTSVYRALESLEELGAVRHVHLGHGPGLYALAGEKQREYLMCERCDRVLAVEPAELNPVRLQIEAMFGFQARFAHFPIMGLCDECTSGSPP